MAGPVTPIAALFEAVDELAGRAIADGGRCEGRQRAIRSPAAVWAAIHAHAEARAATAKRLAGGPATLRERST